MEPKGIDFLIIGAQKCATTSLFRYISAHRSVYMPPEKEISFFSVDEKFEKGPRWYLDEHFRGADPSKLWGEASPDYMYFRSTPERIVSCYPGVALLSILRNPIERAHSHYQMAVARGIESRSFLECVRRQIGRRCDTDCVFDPVRKYLILGEFGRILSNYLQFFRRSRLKIVFVEDLGVRTAEVVNSIFHFLEVSPCRPGNLERRYNVGGTSRLDWLARVRERSSVKRCLRTLLPAQVRRTLGYWFISELIIKSEDRAEMCREATSLLVDYYWKDVEILESILGQKTPWEDFNR